MKELKISTGLGIHALPKENISDFIRAALQAHKDAGFEAADFGMGLLDLSADGWQPIAEQAVIDSKEIGIPFSVCHLPFMPTGVLKDSEQFQRFNEKLMRALEAAVVVGSEYAVLHPNTTTLPIKQYSRKEQFDQVMEHLSPVVERANQLGVSVVVENMRLVPRMCPTHRFCQYPDELCEVADALGIGVCWDFGHANVSGVRQSEGLAYIGKRLKVIHVNDNVGVDDDHVLPFMGNIDWRDAMHGLALAEFEGVFNFELSAGKAPAAMRKTYIQYVIDSANVLMSYIE